MRLALVDGERSPAWPKLVGHCPVCCGEVIAKCGPVNVWHWAHKAANCDTWAERDTQWHVDWQSRFPTDWCEIPIGDHRADVRRGHASHAGWRSLNPPCSPCTPTVAALPHPTTNPLWRKGTRR